MNDNTDLNVPSDADDEGGFVDLTPEGDEPQFDNTEFDFAEFSERTKDQKGSGDQTDQAGQTGQTGQEEEQTEDVAGVLGETESPELAAARSEINALQAKLEETESKLLRTAADFQNFVRRAAQNVDEAKQEALMKVSKSLVGVLDNFDRATENFDPETASGTEVLEGVESIRAALMQALGGFGLQRLDVAPGDDFDPNVHEALMRQPSEDVESGQIAMQMMPGYMLNDTPVRPVQVGVAQ
ncbi:MAG: nucleotide exchange factor GrpE [Algisphaera sp.]